MSTLSTMEEMAIEVLRGNLAAGKALADMLVEDESVGTRIPTVKKITQDIGRIRVVAYFPINKDVDVDVIGFQASVEDWLREGGALILTGVERLELYELTGPQPES